MTKRRYETAGKAERKQIVNKWKVRAMVLQDQLADYKAREAKLEAAKKVDLSNLKKFRTVTMPNTAVAAPIRAERLPMMPRVRDVIGKMKQGVA